MILTDYLRAAPDATWTIAAQCGVRHAVIRLPEDPDFDVTSLAHLRDVTGRYRAAGFTPPVVEPLPNELHDHIKAGDERRDEAIGRFIALMANLREVGVGTVCFNFMAHYGWTRTATDLPDRGGATVTGFRLRDFTPDDTVITADELWANYAYFLRAVLPYAEKYGVRLALHPDDPPLPALGGVARILTSLSAVEKAMSAVPSPMLGVTFCQACFKLMGEDTAACADALAERIFFIHFRNVRGTKTDFRETFHDDGEIDMARMIRLYVGRGLNVPIRVDHVPALAGEARPDATVPGYDALARLYALGYLRGLLEATQP